LALAEIFGSWRTFGRNSRATCKWIIGLCLYESWFCWIASKDLGSSNWLLYVGCITIYTGWCCSVTLEGFATPSYVLKRCSSTRYDLLFNDVSEPPCLVHDPIRLNF
jgi:hypothetical protein